ncbi:MAG: hypothetical protein AAF431_14780 [Pseudomonadota bacterium]
MNQFTGKNLTPEQLDQQLDQLFARAVQTEPVLSDDNFTKVVLNRLPAKPKRRDHKRYFPDLLGLMIGLLVASLVIEPAQLMQKILAYVPETIVISPANVLSLAMGLSAMALLAWWTVERNN